MSISQFFKDVMNKVFAYSNYELVNTVITLFQLRRLRYWAFQEIVSSIGNCGGYLLDLGAGGDGSMTRFVIRNGLRHRPVILLDPAINGLKSMGDQYSEIIDKVVGVSEYLPIRRGSICAVYTSFALRQFSNKPMALLEYVGPQEGCSFIVLEFWRPDNPLTYAILLFYLVFVLPLLVSIVAPREVWDYATMRITVRDIGGISWLRRLIRELIGNIVSYRTYLGIFLLIRAVKT